MKFGSPLGRAEVASGALLVAALAYVWLNPDLSLKNVTWAAPAAQPVAYGALIKQHMAPSHNLVKDSTELLVIQERPLFILGRKPVPPALSQSEATAAVPEKNIWDSARVLGIFEGDVAGVIFHAEGKDHRLLLNQNFEGWTLRAVQQRSIQLEKSGKTKVVNLIKADISAVAAAAKPVPTRRSAASRAVPAIPAVGDQKAGEVKKSPPPPTAVFGGTASK